jgi:hypothetical protein
MAHCRFRTVSRRQLNGFVTQSRRSRRTFPCQSNVTPIRHSLRQTTRQGGLRPSDGTIKVNLSGMKSGVTTSRAAPVSEMLRMVQSITPPPKLIDPALSTRRRGAVLCSSPNASNYAPVRNLQPGATSQGRDPAPGLGPAPASSFNPIRGISTGQFGQPMVIAVSDQFGKMHVMLRSPDVKLAVEQLVRRAAAYRSRSHAHGSRPTSKHSAVRASHSNDRHRCRILKKSGPPTEAACPRTRSWTQT